MPLKKYSIAFRIDDALAQAAIKRSVSGLEKMDQVARRALNSMGRAFDGVAAAAQRSGAAQVRVSNSTTAAVIGNSVKQSKAAVTEAEKKAKQLQAIEDALLRKEYRQRIDFERRKANLTEQEAKRAAARSER